MTQASSESKCRVSVTHAEGGEHLVMMVATGTACAFHQISLAQARALSLDIIKQVYRAEVRNQQLGKPVTSSTFSFPTRHRTQT
jgi:hypothetical protein